MGHAERAEGQSGTERKRTPRRGANLDGELDVRIGLEHAVEEGADLSGTHPVALSVLEGLLILCLGRHAGLTVRGMMPRETGSVIDAPSMVNVLPLEVCP